METQSSVQSIIQYKEPIPTHDIFKVCILNEANSIRKMIVFQGSDKPIAKDSAIFSEVETLRSDQAENIEIQPSTFQLHPDDSIHVLKMKILHELALPSVSYGELYLFSKKRITLHLHELYMEVTKNDTVPLTKPVIGQLLNNLQIVDTDTLKYFAEMKNPSYTYVEFINGLSKYIRNMEISIPVGHRFAKSRELLFASNPYDVTQANPLVFQSGAMNPLILFENHLLLTYGNLVNNTLYLCFADDVLKYGERMTIATDYFMKLYYPLLAKRDIYSNDDLIQARPALMKLTDKMMKPAFFQKYKNTDAFYDIYNSRMGELPYSKQGIENFHLILHPVSTTVFPLDIVFKQMHATANVPFIKYNPGYRREPLYRLYSVKRTKYGKKIPELSRTQIMSYSKVTGKPKQLSFVVNYMHKNAEEHVFVHINTNGDIVVNGACAHTMTAADLTRVLVETINPLLTKMNDVLDASGYKVSMFEDVYDERIEYINLKYTCGITRNFNIKPTELTTILSNMFHVYEADINKGAILRFKNVENYKEMNAMNALITQIYKTTNDLTQVKKAIMENFILTDDEAREHINKYLNEHIIINGNYVNKSIDVAENPGFPCLMRTSTAYATPEIIIEIAEINSIQYIDVIHRYLDVFLRVTQHGDKSTVSKDKLLKMMAKTKNIEDDFVQENVIASTTQPIQPFALKPITDVQDEDGDGDEGMLFFDDDDEDGAGAGKGEEEYKEEDGIGDGIYADDDEPEQLAKPPNKPGLLFQDDDDGDDPFFGGANMFFNKMKKLEPTLFRTKKEGKFDSYARTCPSQSSRQPVILTKEELDTMDEAAYKVAMPYGTDKDKQYWYICPRYWCLQTNKPMTNAQVANEECGGKIIKDIKNPEPGHYIYEFTDERQHKYTDKSQYDKEDGDYRRHRPGFLGDDKHPDPDYCLPCCFKEMNTTQQITRRQECGVLDANLRGNTDVINKLINPKPKEPAGKKKAEKPAGPDEVQGHDDQESEDDQDGEAEQRGDDDKVDHDDKATEVKPAPVATVVVPAKPGRIGINVMGVDKVHIDKSRWGFLPLSVELFLRTDNSTSINKNNPALIKTTETPLLRYGVEYSDKQSFIACIADLYTYNNNVPVPSISEMRKIIVSHISLDVYVKSNNGALVSIFQPKKTIVDDITVEKYKTTELYKSIDDLSNVAKNRFLKDTIASYQNFIAFMENDDSFIDHTYVWDIITSADTGIFKNGINIALIEIVDSDITDNVAVLCPSNSYSAKPFDLAKGTCILLKHDSFYTPIYLHGNTNASKLTKKNAVKIFSQQNTPPNLLNVFEMINKTTSKYCTPRASLPNVYDYKPNLSALEIYEILTEKRLIIKKQVHNYRNKVIAFIVATRAEDETGIYVPTAPSAPIKNVQTIFTDAVVWQEYNVTRDRLTQLANKMDGKLLCKPAFKVVEDGLIVGIFTETNQFVSVSKPAENIIEDGIPEYQVHGYKDNQYYAADTAFATVSTPDLVRAQTIRNISLESHFYNLFRSKLRNTLADYKYKAARDEIIHIINNNQYLYKTKMKKLENLIRHVLTPRISFIEFDEEVLKHVNEMNAIIKPDEINKICLLKENKLCAPQKHLVSGIENDRLYYTRLADELIRYTRIRTFILDPTKYLNIGSVEYQVDETEILYLHSLLVSEDFDKLVAMPTNKYIGNVSRDYANPFVSTNAQTSTDVALTEQYRNTANASFDILKAECVSKTVPVESDKKNWRAILHENAVEHILSNSVQCSFYIIMLILREHKQINENIYEIKRRLCGYYETLIKQHYDTSNNTNEVKIYHMLGKQGKQQVVNMLSTKRIDVSTMIMNDSYILTAIDIWVFAINMKLPIIIFDSNGSLPFAPTLDWLRLGGNPETDKFYFVRMISNAQYNLITPPSPLRELNGFEQMIQSPLYDKHIQSFQEFMQNYIFGVPNIKPAQVRHMTK